MKVKIKNQTSDSQHLHKRKTSAVTSVLHALYFKWIYTKNILFCKISAVRKTHNLIKPDIQCIPKITLKFTELQLVEFLKANKNT